MVIAARNEERVLGRCLEALRQQRTEVPFEVIVVNNGSTDATDAVAARFGCRVVDEPRLGQLFAKDRGVREAKAAIVAVLDADCEPNVDWVQKVKTRLSAQGPIVAVTGYYSFGRDMPVWGRGYVWLVKCGLVRLYQSTLRSMPFVLGGNVAFRRAAYFDSGGYPLWGGIGQTEIGLARRLSRVGLIALCPELKVRSDTRRFQQGWFHFAFRYKWLQYFWPLVVYFAKTSALSLQSRLDRGSRA